MSRKLTPRSSLQTLKREAKRWLRQLRDGDPGALARFAATHPQPPATPTLRDVQLALAREHGVPGWSALLAELERLERAPAEDHESQIARFLRWACQDWRTNGDTRVFRMHDAQRLLDADASLARASVHAAVACGDVEYVARVLADRPEAASQPGGPHGWPPLLYLCSARLPHRTASENAVAIARLLLDHGADPNAFYLGGNADIHYTALTCVLGRGEELALTHPRARELVALLLERGADPHDNQVLYNVFADNTSRHLLAEDMLWLLELMHQHSVRRGFQRFWDDPTWPMLAMRGAPSLGDGDKIHHGAYFMLSAAVDRNLPGMCEWMLAHGADPNCPPGTPPWAGAPPLYERAVRKGHMDMARLLERYGARASQPELSDHERYVHAVLALDGDQVRRFHARHPEWLQDHRALWEVIHRNRGDAVRLLLDEGVSPDIASAPGGARAMHMAAADRSLDALRALIAAGADVDARENGYDGSALTWASHFGQHEAIAVLAPHARDIWHLVYTGCAHRVAELLAEHPELARTVGSTGWTPLMWLPDDADAALEIARAFLAHGADPSVRNAEGDTAADIAARRGLADVARLLSVALR